MRQAPLLAMQAFLIRFRSTQIDTAMALHVQIFARFSMAQPAGVYSSTKGRL